jgi:hypothetical protein
MSKRVACAVLMSWLCVSCAITPLRFAGDYNPANYIYSNGAVGFRLILPPLWTVRTTPDGFTVPVLLRTDQEKVLEAYEPASQLGLVIVVQQGPLLEIPDLVQKMRRPTEERLAQQLQRPDAVGFRQLAVQEILLNGHPTAEWIYTVTDMTGSQPAEVTVSNYIIKVRENYVYITFATPAVQYTDARPTLDAVLNTFATL